MAEFKTAVVVPNWNGRDSLRACLDSLMDQSESAHIIVVDNGSRDGSAEFIRDGYPSITLIKNKRNLGFAGGVNKGLLAAIDMGVKYVALFNNDAVADKNWLEYLVSFMDRHSDAGIATSKISDLLKVHLDSTGEMYTTWGLPFPRGRGEEFSSKYDTDTWVFGGSGGASIYRIKMLKEIDLFDEDFFAYYEDVDISFRAQLANWKVGYVPTASAYHTMGATSSKIKGFTTYQTMKNLPMLVIKNVPGKLYFTVMPRLELAYWAFFISAVKRGQGWPALKGLVMSLLLTPKKFWQRQRIQSHRKVSTQYIDSMLTHDLPPNAYKLRRLRSRWWKLRGRRS